MEETQKEKDDAILAEALEGLFKQGKDLILTLAKHEKMNRGLRHRMCISLISMMITEAGIELYPIFRKHELNGFLNRINACIEEMSVSMCDDCDDEESEETDEDEAVKLSSALTKAAEDLASGKAKIKFAKVCLR
jgi:hypothetical protein